MTGPATATVKVLTAEVRVLMVGARQVTLSVYRQLDWVPPGCLEPFGRVNDRPDGGVEVVGRSARARDRGALVRSRVVPSIERQQAEGWRQSAEASRKGSIIYTADGRGELTAEDCDRHASVAEARVRLATGEWSELPLIVLAGLR
jgi:hypothetical protein